MNMRYDDVVIIISWSHTYYAYKACMYNIILATCSFHELHVIRHIIACDDDMPKNKFSWKWSFRTTILSYHFHQNFMYDDE